MNSVATLLQPMGPCTCTATYNLSGLGPRRRRLRKIERKKEEREQKAARSSFFLSPFSFSLWAIISSLREGEHRITPKPIRTPFLLLPHPSAYVQCNIYVNQTKHTQCTIAPLPSTIECGAGAPSLPRFRLPAAAIAIAARTRRQLTGIRGSSGGCNWQ